MIEGMERLGFDVTHVYGLTETYRPAAVCAKHEDWDSLDSTGRVQRNGRSGVRHQLQDAMTVIDQNDGTHVAPRRPDPGFGSCRWRSWAALRIPRFRGFEVGQAPGSTE